MNFNKKNAKIGFVAFTALGLLVSTIDPAYATSSEKLLSPLTNAIAEVIYTPVIAETLGLTENGELVCSNALNQFFIGVINSPTPSGCTETNKICDNAGAACTAGGGKAGTCVQRAVGCRCKAINPHQG